MIFKLYDCDVGVTLEGVTYSFVHVDEVTYEDPETTKLIRGANLGNKLGLAYKEGSKEAKKIGLTVKGMPAELHTLLKNAYANQTRMGVFCISRVDGSSKTGKNCILSSSPKQLKLDDSPESMNTTLQFESFDIDEVHKT